MTEELVSVPRSRRALATAQPTLEDAPASEKQFDTVVPGEDLVDGLNNHCGREVIAVDQTNPYVWPQCFRNSVSPPVNGPGLIDK